MIGARYINFSIVYINSDSGKFENNKLQCLSAKMPSIINNTGSPSCKFKLVFCSECKEEIGEDREVNCDNCGKFFHMFCINKTSDSDPDGLIMICETCSNAASICSLKDRLEIKSIKAIKSTTKSLSQPEPRKLRERAISVDYFGTNKTKRGINTRATATEKSIEELLLKVNKMQTQIEILESHKCNCKVTKQITGDSDLNTNKNDELIVQMKKRIDTFERAFGDTAEFAGDEKTSIDKRFFKIERALNDLSVFEKSNYDGLLSINACSKEIEAKFHKLNDKINGCSMVHETNLSAIIEIQSKVAKNSAQIDEYFNQSNLNSVDVADIRGAFVGDFEISNTLQSLDKAVQRASEDFAKLFDIITDFSIALKQHNNTVKTHFDLNDAYNHEIMRKIESKIEKCTIAIKTRPFGDNKIKDNIKGKRQISTDDSRKESSVGTMTIKSLYTKPISNKLKILLRDIKTDKTIAEIQNELTNTFSSCLLETYNIKWHTNKLSFDPVSHHITAAQIIAILPEPINVGEFSKKVSNFFGTNTS